MPVSIGSELRIQTYFRARITDMPVVVPLCSGTTHDMQVCVGRTRPHLQGASDWPLCGDVNLHKA
jgi:hypothetical protein